jgi:hypothetical protein
MFRDGLRLLRHSAAFLPAGGFFASRLSASFSLVSNPSDDHLPVGDFYPNRDDLVGDFFAGRRLFRRSAAFSPIGSFFASWQSFG